MKFMLFPSAKNSVAHIVSAPSADCVKAYVRSRFGRYGLDFCATGESAIENVELRLKESENRLGIEKGVLEVRSRPIGKSAPWSAWSSLEVGKR